MNDSNAMSNEHHKFMALIFYDHNYNILLLLLLLVVVVVVVVRL